MPTATVTDKKIPKRVSIWAGGKVYRGHPDGSGFLFFKELIFLRKLLVRKIIL
jgi:hypothetical protein